MKSSSLVTIFSLRLFGVLLSFLLNIYFSRTLEKEELGHYFWLIQILMVTSVFVKGGVDLASLKYGGLVNNYEAKKYTINYSIYFLIPTIILALFSVIIAKTCLSPQTYLNVLFVSLSVIPYSIFNIISELLKARKKQKSGALIQACLLPVFIFSTFTFTTLSLLYSYIFSINLLMAISLIWVIYTFNTPKNTSSLTSLKESRFWIESKGFLVIAILNITMNSMDLLMLGIFKDSSTVAEYAIANKLVALSSIILIVVNGIIGPKFSELWADKQKKELNKLFIKITFMMLLTSISMLLFFIFAGKVSLAILYGSQYKSSYELLVVLAFGQAIVLGTGPVAYLLMMTSSQNIYRRSLVVAVVINFILNLFLIPMYGALGAAGATAIGLITKNIYGLIIANRLYGFFKPIH